MYLLHLLPFISLVYCQYDFIIIGGGSSGSVIANRLSEVSNWRILLLEAGSYPNPLTDIPAIATYWQFTDYNWGYLAEKQTNSCLGLIDQRVAWPRGKILGGSSVINYMIATRGHPNDYNLWGGDNPGWSYQDVLPYFLKAELNLNIERNPSHSETSKVFVQSCLETGFQDVSYINSTTQNGRRTSTEKSYLRISRSNLKIVTNARVVRILINLETKETIGVEYHHQRRLRVAYAHKEVILSAGALNSPQLLMLSGIGPREHLKQLNINLIVDLPVGEKLYDHVIFPGLVYQLNKTASTDSLLSGLKQWLWKGTGPLTSTGGVDNLLFLNTGTKDRPDIELLYSENSLHSDPGQVLRKSLRITDEIYDRVWRPLEGTTAVTLYVGLLHPKSYGFLKLQSKNPYHWPRFYPNYFTDLNDEDIGTLLKGMRQGQRLFKANAWLHLNATLVSTPINGCEHISFDSDAYWTCALRHIGVSIYHQTGTCRMGPRNDPNAIVDNNLTVYGVKKLRIADASVIPITISGHTNLPSVMIGEKVSDLIKKNWLI